MTNLEWRRASRLSVSGSSEWAPVERLDVVRLDGKARVTVETWPVAEADFNRIVDEHGKSFAATVAHWHEDGLDNASVLGHEGKRRRCAWIDTDGTPVAATIGYRLDSGAVYVVTTAVRSQEAGLVADAERVAASVVITQMLRPVDQPAASTPPVRDEPSWGEARRAWTAWPDSKAATARDAAASLPPRTRITFEEAIAAARQRSGTGFPGVEPRFLEPLGIEGSRVALRVAGRSLAARAATHGELEGWLSVATAHDLLVMRESGQPGGASVTWYALRPDAAVTIDADPSDGTVTLDAFDPALLPATLLGDLPSGAAAHQQQRLSVSSQLVAALVRGDADVSAHPQLEQFGSGGAPRTRIRTVYRDGTRLLGGELEWLDGGAAGIWRVTRHSNAAGIPECTLETTGREQLHAALSDLLPGRPGHPAHTDQKPEEQS